MGSRRTSWAADMIESVSLRLAQASDETVLIAIRRDAILRLAVTKMGEDGVKAWADSAAVDRVQRAIDLHEVWLADQRGGPVGWVELHLDRIEGLYVRSTRARRGLGSALLLHAEARIKSAGYSAALLDASSNAEEFYLRRGYEMLPEEGANGSRPMSKVLRLAEASDPDRALTAR